VRRTIRVARAVRSELRVAAPAPLRAATPRPFRLGGEGARATACPHRTRGAQSNAELPQAGRGRVRSGPGYNFSPPGTDFPLATARTASGRHCSSRPRSRCAPPSDAPRTRPREYSRYPPWFWIARIKISPIPPVRRVDQELDAGHGGPESPAPHVELPAPDGDHATVSDSPSPAARRTPSSVRSGVCVSGRIGATADIRSQLGPQLPWCTFRTAASQRGAEDGEIAAPAQPSPHRPRPPARPPAVSSVNLSAIRRANSSYSEGGPHSTVILQPRAGRARWWRLEVSGTPAAPRPPSGQRRPRQAG